MVAGWQTTHTNTQTHTHTRTHARTHRERENKMQTTATRKIPLGSSESRAVILKRLDGKKRWLGSPFFPFFSRGGLFPSLFFCFFCFDVLDNYPEKEVA